MTAVIAAMDEEVALLRAKMTEKSFSVVCGIECCVGVLGKEKIVLIKSGIGKVAAASAASVAIAVFRSDRVINTGLCGGKFQIGQIVVADRCVQHDMDMTANGCERGRNFDFDSAYFYSNASLSASLSLAFERVGISSERVGIASGDVFIADKGRMDEICTLFDARAVDMESGAVAQVCTRAAVPFAVVRAVSDGGDSVADFRRFTEKVCAVFSSALFAFFETPE